MWQFPEPRAVRAVSDDGQWVFVEGSDTAVPIGEVRVAERPRGSHLLTPDRARPLAPAQTPPPTQATESGIRRDVFTMDEGEAILMWPSRMSPESYEDLKDWMQIQIRKMGRSVVRGEGD